MNRFSQILICCVCFVLVSCRSGPPPRQFLLEPVLDSGQEFRPPVLNAIALAEVMVPKYAEDARVASRDTDFEIYYEERIKWAESADEGLTRVLADRLRYYLAANVIVEPWPRGYEPDARVEVQFDKLLREETGGAEVAGQIRLIAGDGKSMIDVRTFHFVRYANSRNANAYFAALSAAVNDISRMAADSLRAYKSPTGS